MGSRTLTVAAALFLAGLAPAQAQLRGGQIMTGCVPNTARAINASGSLSIPNRNAYCQGDFRVTGVAGTRGVIRWQVPVDPNGLVECACVSIRP
jgi:hypothetical protein